MIWREKRILLIVLGLLLVANTVFFFTYRVQYKERLDALDFRLDQAKAQLQEARRSQMATEAQVAAYRRIEQDVQQIFNERWATESERFTRLVTEVKRLAMKLAEFDRRMPPPGWPALMEQAIRIDVPSDAPWRADQEYVYWSN